MMELVAVALPAALVVRLVTAGATMPWTGLFFLIGAMAISGLPLLNGFPSEWLTFQALLLGFTAVPGLVRLNYPLAGAMLALTSALAAACFVRAFGIGFLALPRSAAASEAHGRPRRSVEALAEASPYFPHEVRYRAEVEPTFERYVYGPLVRGVMLTAGAMRVLQAGSLHTYLAHVLVLAVVLLVWLGGPT